MKSIVLYMIGICLLIFGNRELWDKIVEQKIDAKNKEKAFSDAAENIKKGFETQSVIYDSVNNKWSNSSFYFQVIKGGLVAKNVKNSDKGAIVERKISVETNDDENASESN